MQLATLGQFVGNAQEAAKLSAASGMDFTDSLRELNSAAEQKNKTDEQLKAERMMLLDQIHKIQ